MWCIHVSYLAPEWGRAQHPIIRHWERSAVRYLMFTLGTFRESRLQVRFCHIMNVHQT